MEDSVMLLCDVGNTSYHFLALNSQSSEDINYKKSVSTFSPQELKAKVFYICVNSELKEMLAGLQNWIDLAQFIDMTQYYETMGIDRIVACQGVSENIIIDAGSAITVDIVRNEVFEGGFIYPGIKAMGDAYANISSALAYEFNYNLNLDIIPKNSQDALSYGYLKLLHTEVMSHNLDVIITGGDADKLHQVFPHAKREDTLIFNSMQKIIKKAKLC